VLELALQHRGPLLGLGGIIKARTLSVANSDYVGAGYASHAGHVQAGETDSPAWKAFGIGPGL